jgi:hypothetical protein
MTADLQRWPPTEAASLSDDAAVLFTHERIISIDLAGKSRPALGQIFQNLGFIFTLRQFHQPKTFCRLILTVLCAIHKTLAPRANTSKSQYLRTITPQGSSPRTIPFGYH